MMQELLQVEGLSVSFAKRVVLRQVSLAVNRGETLGIVGESGSGKSVTALSIMGLLSSPGRVTGGSIRFAGKDLLAISEDSRRALRGGAMAMIFQEPMTCLNPVYTVEQQIAEVLITHRGMNKHEARDAAADYLQKVRIADPLRRLKSFPHELSGGMRQRVMIAMALAGQPEILIADEPTTALDVTVQAQILDLLKSLQAEMGMAMILITHDLGLIAEYADRGSVMYAGEVVETGLVSELFEHPSHPYTQGLLRSLPRWGEVQNSLYSIPGSVPREIAIEGCAFAERCPKVDENCGKKQPVLQVSPTQFARCQQAARVSSEVCQACQ